MRSRGAVRVAALPPVKQRLQRHFEPQYTGAPLKPRFDRSADLGWRKFRSSFLRFLGTREIGRLWVES